MSNRITLIIAAILLAIAAVYAFVPSYGVVLITRILILGLFAISLDLLEGYVGLTSLGHACFLGSAGYVAAFVTFGLTTNLLAILAISVFAAVVLGAIFGAIMLRSTGVYFIMLSLALGQVMWGLAWQGRSVTHGDDGLSGIPRPHLWDLSFDDNRVFFVMVALITAAATLCLIRVTRSAFGLTLLGIRESAGRMNALGYNVWLHKYFAFLISCGLAGLAGALLTLQNGVITPAQLSVHTSAMGLVMGLVGGVGTIIGPLLGSLTIVVLEFMVSRYTERWGSILGILYVLIVLFAPRGLLFPLVDSMTRFFRRSRAPHPSAPRPAPSQPEA